VEWPTRTTSLEVERLDERREVVGVGVQIVAAGGLTRAAVAATVVGDGAVAVLGQEEHLILPGVAIERPAVAEDYGLSFTPVFVIDLGAVFGRDPGAALGRVRLHRPTSLFVGGCRLAFSITPRAY
jgi:hypothetical protein